MVLYRIFYAFCWMLASLPMRGLYLISDFLYLIVHYVVRYRYSVIMENLRKSFPEKTEKEHKQIAKQFHLFMCDLFLESVKVLNIRKEKMHQRIYYSNPEMFNDLSRKNKQILFVPGHYGNWEWLATLQGTIAYQLATLYQPLNNKIFDRFFYDLRTRYGTIAVPSNMAIREINKNIEENRLTALCFLSDQSPHPGPANYWTTFLNQETAVYTGIEKLARRYNTAVVYYEVWRVRRGYYTVNTTLITENAAETQPMEITQKHVDLLEETIRKAPQYWLWSHRRWKLKKNE